MAKKKSKKGKGKKGNYKPAKDNEPDFDPLANAVIDDDFAVTSLSKKSNKSKSKSKPANAPTGPLSGLSAKATLYNISKETLDLLKSEELEDDDMADLGEEELTEMGVSADQAANVCKAVRGDPVEGGSEGPLAKLKAVAASHEISEATLKVLEGEDLTDDDLGDLEADDLVEMGIDADQAAKVVAAAKGEAAGPIVLKGLKSKAAEFKIDDSAVATLEKEGLDDEDLFDLEKGDYKDMGIKLGQALRIVKAVNALKSASAPAEQPKKEEEESAPKPFKAPPANKGKKGSKKKGKPDDNFDDFFAELDTGAEKVEKKLSKAQLKRRRQKEAREAAERAAKEGKTVGEEGGEEATKEVDPSKMTKAQRKRYNAKLKKAEEAKKKAAKKAEALAKLQAERIRLEELEKKKIEDEKKAIEEEKHAAEEAKRKAEEDRVRRKEEKKRKRLEMKKAGLILTKKQREERKRLEQIRKRMEAQGLTVPEQPTDSNRRQNNRRNNKRQNKPKSKKLLALEAEKKRQEEAAAAAAAEAEKAKLKAEGGGEDGGEDDNDVADAWDAGDDDEDGIADTWEDADDADEKAEEEKKKKEEEERKKKEAEEAEERRKEAERKNKEEQRQKEEAKRNTKKSGKAGRGKKGRKGRDKDDRELRSPICCILGHVDTGKTKLLDKMRSTNVQDREAGGITQQIGATYFPMSNIEKATQTLVQSTGKELNAKMPGLLMIDTPGHESFTNLRARGSNLCDIAILVVDIMHGLEPQTLESIRLLKERKTPFIVALNKIDRLFDWESTPDGSIRESLKKQKQKVIQEFNTRTNEAIAAFAKEAELNTCLYYKNKNPKEWVSLVPTSAHTGEGIPDILWLLVKMTQTFMRDNLAVSYSTLQCTVLEVKKVEGLGTTIDVVLVNGVLHEGDTIVVCGLQGPIVTSIRALLTPPPMKEIRVKSEYVHHKEIKAAMGVKITANGLENAVAGTQLLVCGPRDNIEDLKDDCMSDLASILSRVDSSGQGVYVQASTLGSLEALLQFLEESKVPVSGLAIGPVHKKDVMKAAVMREHKEEYSVILAFDVEASTEAKQMALEMGVTIFTADIIYHLFDMVTKYFKEIRDKRRAEAAPKAVFPCILKTIPAFVFNKRSPIVIGVEVVEGILRKGTPLCVTIRKPALDIGHVTSIEFEHKERSEAKKGEQVCIKIEQNRGNQIILLGRHFTVEDPLVSKLTRESIRLLKDNFKEDLTQDDWKLVVKLKKVFGIHGKS